jgi:hypothetical protein
MLTGPLHDRGDNGRCTECGEPFLCSTGIAIYESVVPQPDTDQDAPYTPYSPPDPPSINRRQVWALRLPRRGLRGALRRPPLRRVLRAAIRLDAERPAKLMAQPPE